MVDLDSIYMCSFNFDKGYRNYYVFCEFILKYCRIIVRICEGLFFMVFVDSCYLCMYL